MNSIFETQIGKMANADVTIKGGKKKTFWIPPQFSLLKYFRNYFATSDGSAVVR